MDSLSAQRSLAGDDVVPATGPVLIVLLGQSTALSYGLVSSLTDTTLAAAYPNVQMLSRQAFQDDDPPVWTDSSGNLDSITFQAADRVGLEVLLMRDLDRARPGRFAFARVAIGGSTSAEWGSGGTYPTGTNLFTQAIAYIVAAKAALNARRVVICWEHGASDAKTLFDANSYLGWLGTFLTALRAQLGTVPFVYGKMNVNNSIVTFPYRTELRASQVAFESTMPFVKLVDEDAITITGVGGHYNGNEYAAVGRLYAVAVGAMLGCHIPPLASYTVGISNLDVTFTDTSVAPGSSLASWLWTFGDGNTSTLQNPVHSYAADGTYNVTLQVTDAVGSTNTSAAAPVVVAAALAVTRDATSTVYVPANGTEWVTLLNHIGNPLATPNSCWQCNETSAGSSLADSVGSLTMTWNGTAGSYNVAVSGWTRHGVAAASGTSTKFAAPSGSGPNPTTTSSLWMWFIDVTAVPSAIRQLAAVGGGSASFDGSLSINTSSAMRARCVGVTTDGAVDAVSGGVVPFFLQYDRTNGKFRCVSNGEVVTGTYSGSVVDSFKGVFAGGGGTAAAATAVFGAMWSGANAEVGTAAMKSLMQGMGFAVAW